MQKTLHELSLRALRAFQGVGPVDLWAGSTAVLLIDMQVACVSSRGHNIQRLRECGLDVAAIQYEQQLRVAIPNLARLLARFRKNQQPVVHTHVVSLPGRRRGGQPREAMPIPFGSDQAQIIDELAPQPGETVLAKGCSNVFAGTNLEFLLHRMEITSLVVGGVVTNGCVEQAVNFAHDLGYACVLVSDACAALTDELHVNALERLQVRRAHVLTTDSLMSLEHVAALGAS